MNNVENKIVDSKVYPLKELFADKFDVDFYQREYVWQRKQLEDLIIDLSTEFLKNWDVGDNLKTITNYDPYYMGEIVLSLKDNGKSTIIDGQQRITTLTLLLIYLLRTYGNVEKFPKGEIEKLIYSDFYGDQIFNLEIEERKKCMLELFNNGQYLVQSDDTVSVKNIVARYSEISECWNENINENNIVNFTYWLKEKVMFSKVWTNSDEFAYVIFETMNDRGLSLTQVEMLRSYLLANIDATNRQNSLKIYDKVISDLLNIKLTSKSKAEFEFFKIFLRSQYAKDFSQTKNSNSDFVRIGKEFHRWVRDNSVLLGLYNSNDYIEFIKKIEFYAKVYQRINKLIQERNSRDYLYLIVNSDYGFTLQPAPIIACVNYNDDDSIIDKKIKIVSKYLTKVLSWRVWNHYMISQSSLESSIYELCSKIRNKNCEELESFLATDPIDLPKLENAPTLNQQNKQRIKVLISLITEIVAQASNEPNYMLNNSDIEVEHIWSNHYEEHLDEFDNENDFANVRNSIGGLLVLPKSFNASYGDDNYEIKVKQYFSQNILAQTLCEQKYKNNPGFLKFIEISKLPFKPYNKFKKASFSERANLYKSILMWNWNNNIK